MSKRFELEVGDKLDKTSNIDMDKLKEIRLSGMCVVTNDKINIIKFIGIPAEAKEFYNIQKRKRGGAYLLHELINVRITREEIMGYHKIQSAIISKW